MKKRFFLIIISAVIMSTVSGWTLNRGYEFVKEYTIEGDNWVVYKMENLAQKVSGDTVSYVLDEIRVTNDSYLEMSLDFEGEITNLANYSLIHSDFLFNEYQSSTGLQSGKFYMPGHYISLLPKSTSIFYPGTVPGSFTIEFDLYLYQTFDYQYVMRYTGQNLSDESDSSTYGFSIYIKDNKLHYKFENFFWSIDDIPYSLEITEEEELDIYNWEHHALSFNIMNGMMSTYKDGIEQEVEWVTEESDFFSPIYNPLVKEELSAPIIIGMNSYFSLDDFKITRTAFNDFYLNRYNNSSGYLITDTYQFSENLSSLKSLSFDYESPDYSFVKLAYRISDSYFLPGNTHIDWVYVQNDLEEFPAMYDTGKYIQFKIEVYPYEEISDEIVINGISFEYSEDGSPNSPILLSAVPGDAKVSLTWLPSTESDIIGYEIYYGNTEQNYICLDSPLGESPIYIDYKLEGELKPLSYELTGLNNETPYFISIRTIDSNQNRSEYSDELFAIPSSIYNKNGYSLNR